MLAISRSMQRAPEIERNSLCKKSSSLAHLLLEIRRSAVVPVDRCQDPPRPSPCSGSGDGQTLLKAAAPTSSAASRRSSRRAEKQPPVPYHITPFSCNRSPLHHSLRQTRRKQNRKPPTWLPRLIKIRCPRPRMGSRWERRKHLTSTPRWVRMLSLQLCIIIFDREMSARGESGGRPRRLGACL